jgi:Protein of unknown function (DUF1570)
VIRIRITACLAFLMAATALGEGVTFDITGHQFSKKQLRRMKEVIDYMASYHHKAGFKERDSVIRIRIFDTRDKLDEYMVTLSPSWQPGRAAGVYVSRTQEVVAYNRPNMSETVFHELQHWMFGTYFRNRPRWLNEGLSEYFECVTFRKGEPKYTIYKSNKRDRIRAYMKKHRTVDLRKFMGLGRWHDLNGEKRWNAYLLSWAIVNYLMSDKAGRVVLTKIMKDVSKGGSGITAVERHYPGGIDQLEKSLMAYARRAPYIKYTPKIAEHLLEPIVEDDAWILSSEAKGNTATVARKGAAILVTPTTTDKGRIVIKHSPKVWSDEPLSVSLNIDNRFGKFIQVALAVEIEGAKTLYEGPRNTLMKGLNKGVSFSLTSKRFKLEKDGDVKEVKLPDPSKVKVLHIIIYHKAGGSVLLDKVAVRGGKRTGLPLSVKPSNDRGTRRPTRRRPVRRGTRPTPPQR